MNKIKKWHLWVIGVILILTVYNILPTLFYYARPLKAPIDEARAESISTDLLARVSRLESESANWIRAFAKNLKISIQQIHFSQKNPALIEVSFQNEKDLTLFKTYFPKAGALIPFVPGQLSLTQLSQDKNKLIIARKILVSTEEAGLHQTQSLFGFTDKYRSEGISSFYKTIIQERLTQVLLAIGGISPQGENLLFLKENSQTDSSTLLAIAAQINDYAVVFGKNSQEMNRFLMSFSRYPGFHSSDLTLVTQGLEKLLQEYSTKLATLKNELSTPVSSSTEIALLQTQQKGVEQALNIFKTHQSMIGSGAFILTSKTAAEKIDQTPYVAGVQTIDLTEFNPLISAFVIDWNNDKVDLKLAPLTLSSSNTTEFSAYQKERRQQIIINEMARLSQVAHENIKPHHDNTYSIALSELTDSRSLLVLHLDRLAEKITGDVTALFREYWKGEDPDLNPTVYPVYSYREFIQLPSIDQKFGLVVYAPIVDPEAPRGFNPNSIYVIAKGLGKILDKNKKLTQQDPLFEQSIRRLMDLLNVGQFLVQYTRPDSQFGPSFKEDIIFECNDYYAPFLKSTREDFKVYADSKYAVLEFTDVEQRILTQNRIDNRIHEDLIRSRDEYESAQISRNPQIKWEVPPPIRSVFWSNLALSTKKYFRGDNRKVLKWGMDLSGGKTVRIGLRDINNRPVTSESDLKQAVNELTRRVNNMGVSEVAIRIEGQNIILDFPSSQGLSAEELVKASSMTFHVINEKFSPYNTAIAAQVDRFLQEVWNEAVVMNRKDIDSIREIAFRQLGGETQFTSSLQGVSLEAKLLYDYGLRIPNPKTAPMSSLLDDSLSTIGMYREDVAIRSVQSHPLVIIFNNYALEGTSLDNVLVGYDPSRGNFLSFDVRKTAHYSDGSTYNPQSTFHAWTSQFSQEKILGTPNETYSGGKGWRMAVMLNGSIISAPNLEDALKSHARITGNFSQREVTQLATDLKAGSLSFQPKILSEQNISPELGLKERSHGILAAVIGLVLLVVIMVGYYRFAGWVASVAVMLNLLIMWAVLQNMDATLTLAGIAGVILTMGMAVDANVLVFERIREEFLVTSKLSAAIRTGFNKAFSAILDSNVTTILAAIILLQFDSGPIKGFALTIIIGIVSSMITALFITKTFFLFWIKQEKGKKLTMSSFIKNTQFPFLKYAKVAIAVSVAIFVLGVGSVYFQGKSILGMDFTGGYAITVDLEEKPDTDYKEAAAISLKKQGAGPKDFQIRQLSRPTVLYIQFARTMEQEGKPFYELPLTLAGETPSGSGWEKNPRLLWLVQALNDGGLVIKPSFMGELEQNWTSMSGQLSETMRNNAVISLVGAIVIILLYLTFRFEFKYGISAVIALIHDVVVTMGIMLILRQCGLSFQLDMQIIGAIMMIIGYSLNDTIIVFDRIREDSKLHKKRSFKELVNQALNTTLSRTIMTSGTTLIVLISLVTLGGSSIFDFSLVMTIGILVGTFSSLFVAPPVMLLFHEREEHHKNQARLT